MIDWCRIVQSVDPTVDMAERKKCWGLVMKWMSNVIIWGFERSLLALGEAQWNVEIQCQCGEMCNFRRIDNLPRIFLNMN